MGEAMGDDYQLPEGFVNPVPDPDEKRPAVWAGWSMPETGLFSGANLGRLLAVVALLVWIFSDRVLEFADDQIQQALDSLETWLESQ
jgi:hypothetical protein